MFSNASDVRARIERHLGGGGVLGVYSVIVNIGRITRLYLVF